MIATANNAHDYTSLRKHCTTERSDKLKGTEVYEKYAKLRDKKGITDYRVAKDLGFARSYLSGMKQGLFTPKFDNLNKLAAYFDVPITYFF